MTTDTPQSKAEEDVVQPTIPADDKPPAQEKPPEQGGAAPPDAGGGKSVFNVPDLLGTFNKTVSALSDVPSWLSASDAILPSETDSKPPAPVDKGALGTKHADAHEARYQELQHRTTPFPLKEGTHKNDDGSSYVVDNTGKVTTFTTVTGMVYSNIKHDGNGEMISYDAPSGHHFARSPQVNQDGFGTWSCTDASGKQVAYAGSNSWSWLGKATADSTGFHTMIGSGPNKGAMYTRAGDGSAIETRFTQRETQNNGLVQTKVVLPDGTQVRRNARLLNGELTVNPKILVTEAAAADADKTANAQRIADKVIQRIADSPNPIAELSAALENMDNLRSATVTRREGDGKHQVEMHFEHGSTVPAINANIRGFRPGPTHIDRDVSFTLSQSQQGGILLENMKGFSGSVTGPLGRVRDSWNNSMHIGRDQRGAPFVDVDSSVRGPLRVRSSSNRFRENQFPEGSPLRHLMRNPDGLKDVTGALRLFQNTDDVKDVSIQKTSAGNFDVALHAKEAKHVPVNQKLEKFGVTIDSIDLASTITASISHDDKGVRLGNMQGMSINLKGLLGDLKVTPKMVGLQTNAEGVPVVHIEIEHPSQPGTIMPFDIPVSKLQELKGKR